MRIDGGICVASEIPFRFMYCPRVPLNDCASIILCFTIHGCMFVGLPKLAAETTGSVPMDWWKTPPLNIECLLGLHTSVNELSANMLAR